MQLTLFIKWQDKNNTGVELIDEQHRGIVSIINSFYYLADKGIHDKTLCSFISGTIKNYSRIHFLTEERILKAAKYPDFKKHVEMHKTLAMETERIERIATGDSDTTPLLNFLKKWWLEHINDQDMQYVNYLHERGKTHNFY
jgi:hemerythrin-like metal-binding protein